MSGTSTFPFKLLCPWNEDEDFNIYVFKLIEAEDFLGFCRDRCLVFVNYCFALFEYFILYNIFSYRTASCRVNGYWRQLICKNI